LGWAAREGWNPGLNDAAAFFAADPGGFLGVERLGSLAGTISAVRYGAAYGFIGLFPVPKAFRGDLVGLRLGRPALERLDGVCVGTGSPRRSTSTCGRPGFGVSGRTFATVAASKASSARRPARAHGAKQRHPRTRRCAAPIRSRSRRLPRTTPATSALAEVHSCGSGSRCPGISLGLSRASRK